jgi:hypothetical protein
MVLWLCVFQVREDNISTATEHHVLAYLSP